MSDLRSTFIRSLPRDARKLFADLLEAQPKTADELAADLDNYENLVDEAQQTIEFFDADSATCALSLARELLGRIDALEGEVRRRAQAAITYLVVVDDGENDFASLTGFDEDIAVLEAVLQC